MRYTLPLQVLSSFEDRPGTLIVREDALKDYAMERQLITGIAYDKNEARLTLTGLPDTPGAAAAIFGALATASINYDMIAQGGPNEITFTVPAASLAQAADVLGRAKAAIGYAELATDTAIFESLDRRRRHPLGSGAGGADVRDARRAKDRNPRHRDLPKSRSRC